MKIRSFVLRPFLIAIGVHLAILVTIIASRYDFSKKNRLYKEPRLLVTFMKPNQQTFIKHSSLKPSLSASTQKAMKHIESKRIKPLLVETKDKPQEVKHEPIIEESSPPIVPMGRVAGLIKRHYGDVFFELSRGEQEFIINNLQKIRRINYPIANAILDEKPQDRIKDRDNNYVEFYLYPDGTVSDITLINEREGALLDELIVETIEHAYSQYPRPKQKTLIRLRSWIIQVQED